MNSYPINDAGIGLIKDSEQLRLVAYLCPASVWTIGYGHTGADVHSGLKITEARAEELLVIDVLPLVSKVLQLCKIKPNANQLAAMVSLAFNIGIGAFANSSVLKAHNRGDTPAAGRAFNLWVKAKVGGKLTELPGLVTRRARESALYLTAVCEADRTPMPQLIAPEPPVATSATTVGTITAGGLGGGAVVVDTISKVGDAAWSLSPVISMVVSWGPLALGVIAAGVLGYVLWRRFHSRTQGWL